MTQFYKNECRKAIVVAGNEIVTLNLVNTLVFNTVIDSQSLLSQVVGNFNLPKYKYPVPDSIFDTVNSALLEQYCLNLIELIRTTDIFYPNTEVVDKSCVEFQLIKLLCELITTNINLLNRFD